MWLLEAGEIMSFAGKEGKGSCREECKTRRKIALLSCIEKLTLSFDKTRVVSLPPTGEVLAKPKLIGT